MGQTWKRRTLVVGVLAESRWHTQSFTQRAKLFTQRLFACAWAGVRELKKDSVAAAKAITTPLSEGQDCVTRSWRQLPLGWESLADLCVEGRRHCLCPSDLLPSLPSGCLHPEPRGQGSPGKSVHRSQPPGAQSIAESEREMESYYQRRPGKSSLLEH